MTKRTVFVAALALALSLSLLGGCAGLTNAPAPNQAEEDAKQATLSQVGTLVLKVNPEISLQYDSEGHVTSVEGLNDDGTAIVNGYANYLGKDCNTVVQDLVMRINDAGYLAADANGNSRTITIEVGAGSVLPTDTFVQDIATDVQTTVDSLNLANPVNSGQGNAQGSAPSNAQNGGQGTTTQNTVPNNNNDTDYGPNNDGVTDYNDTDYGPNNDGVTDYNTGGYGDSGYSDYSDSGYSDYGSS